MLLRSLSRSLSFSSLMGRQEPSVKYSISSMSSLVSFRISDNSLKCTPAIRETSQNKFIHGKIKLIAQFSLKRTIRNEIIIPLLYYTINAITTYICQDTEVPMKKNTTYTLISFMNERPFRKTILHDYTFKYQTWVR